MYDGVQWNTFWNRYNTRNNKTAKPEKTFITALIEILGSLKRDWKGKKKVMEHHHASLWQEKEDIYSKAMNDT